MIPLMRWHECEVCDKVTLVIKYRRSGCVGKYCSACYQWYKNGGAEKEKVVRICPETGKEIPFKRNLGNPRRYLTKRDYDRFHSRDSARKRRQSPAKRAQDYACSKRLYNKYKLAGLCPRCGDVPDTGILCENCKDKMRGTNQRNRRT